MCLWMGLGLIQTKDDYETKLDGDC
jgi:hypothetical protein